MHEIQSPGSSPYRTSDPLELAAELASKERELDKLRAWKKRSRIGVTIALVVATVHVAAFSGLLVLRYVPKQEDTNASSTEPAQAIPADTASEGKGMDEDPCPHTTALDDVGGDEKIPALATDVTRALYSDPTLARSPRLVAFGRAHAEKVVREQLQSLLGATVEDDAEDGFELAWDVRPSRAEWTAMTEVVLKVLEKHGVTSTNLEQLRSVIEGGADQVTNDIPRRRRNLHARASVGLDCPEAKLTSTPLESSYTRVVRGCGKSAIYTQRDVESATAPWEREQNP